MEVTLAVEPQQVVPIHIEAADGRFGADTAAGVCANCSDTAIWQLCCAFV